MFGYPAIFVGGNMCAGLFQDRMFARLPAPDAEALPGGVQPFEPMPGRPMKGYALIPDEVLADEDRLDGDAGEGGEIHRRDAAEGEEGEEEGLGRRPERLIEKVAHRRPRAAVGRRVIGEVGDAERAMSRSEKLWPAPP